jgi:DNA-binding CsgD family transcriptional regulator
VPRARRRPTLSSLEIGRSPLAVALAMFALVFALRLSVDGSSSGVSLLFSIPIILVTIAHGMAAGAAAATLALGLVVVWVEVKGIELGALGIAMRALAFYAVPATIWLAREDLIRGVAAPAASAATTPTAAPKPLTPRESEVLGLLAAGHTNAEIADKLVLSVRTIESHRANLQRKLGRPNRRELVSYALRQGLVPPNQRGISF